MDPHQNEPEVTQSSPSGIEGRLPPPSAVYPPEDLAGWLAARAAGIGSSEAATVLGLAGSPLRLYYEKRGELAEPRPTTPGMKIGLAMEPLIVLLFEDEYEQHGVTIANTEHGRAHVLHRHERYPWMLATVDRFGFHEGEPVVVELKTVSHYAGREWLETGEPPLRHLVQVQHQLAVTGLRRGYLVALIGGFDLRWAPVERDEAFIEGLIAEEARFWRRVEEGNPPPADASEETKDVLRRLYPSGEPRSVPLPVEFIDLDAERERLIGEIKALEERKQAIENRILSHLVDQSAQVGVLANGVQYRWQKVARKAYTVPAGEYTRLFRRAGKES